MKKKILIATLTMAMTFSNLNVIAVNASQIDDSIQLATDTDASIVEVETETIEDEKKDNELADDELISVDSTTFTDENFRNQLREKYADNKGMINPLAIEEIVISGYGLRDLKGIEKFVNLKKLVLTSDGSYNLSSVYYIDLSKNVKLEHLELADSRFSKLDLSHNVNLKTLILHKNTSFKELDLSSNPVLEYVDCAGLERLQKVDISKNTLLKYADFSKCYLSSLDVSNNVYLETLICSKNRYLAEITTCSKDVAALKYLDCSECAVTGLVLNSMTNLEYLNCSKCKLDSLVVDNNRKLKYLNCSENKIAALNVSNNIKLEELNCKENLISNLDLSKHVNLKRVFLYYLGSSADTTLKLGDLNRLEEFGFRGFAVSNEDIYKMQSLKKLECYGDDIDNLDLSKNIGLEDVLIQYTNISEIDLSKNINLKNLNLSYNKLTKLDVSNNKELLKINVDSNLLVDLDVSACEKLQEVVADNNKLKTFSYPEQIARNANPDDYCISVRNNFLPYINVYNIFDMPRFNAYEDIDAREMEQAKPGIIDFSDEAGFNPYLVRELSGAKLVGKTLVINAEGIRNNYVYYYYRAGNSYMQVRINNINEIEEKMLPTPAISKVTYKPEGVSVTWNKISGAAMYGVYRKTSDSKWKLIGKVDENKFVDSSVESGKEYTYTVKCLASDGVTRTSLYDKNGVTVRYISMPEITSATNNINGVKLNWSAQPGASMYRVYRKTADGSWTKVKDTTGVSCVDTTVKSGVTYYYTVKCINPNDASAESAYDTVGMQIKYIATPVISKLANTDTGVSITWGKVAGASKYRVYRRTSGGSWKKLTDTASITYVDTTVKKGIEYSYTVRCVSNDGSICESAYDTVGKTIVFK